MRVLKFAGIGTIYVNNTATTNTVTVTGTKPSDGTIQISSTGELTVTDLKINGYTCNTPTGTGRTDANSDIITCGNSADRTTNP